MSQPNIPNWWKKKPVRIEAFQLDLPMQRACAWFADAMDDGSINVFQDRVEITTLEGVMTATHGDWIIRGINGEIYPCKADIFDLTYERVP